MPPQYAVVRVISIRDTRFTHGKVHYLCHPQLGDVGTILEVYTTPEVAFEVECSDPGSGATNWLEAMHPDEIEIVRDA